MLATVDQSDVQSWIVDVNALHAQVTPCFERAEPRHRVRAYVASLLSPVER